MWTLMVWAPLLLGVGAAFLLKRNRGATGHWVLLALVLGGAVGGFIGNRPVDEAWIEQRRINREETHSREMAKIKERGDQMEARRKKYPPTLDGLADECRDIQAEMKARGEWK